MYKSKIQESIKCCRTQLYAAPAHDDPHAIRYSFTPAHDDPHAIRYSFATAHVDPHAIRYSFTPAPREEPCAIRYSLILVYQDPQTIRRVKAGKNYLSVSESWNSLLVSCSPAT